MAKKKPTPRDAGTPAKGKKPYATPRLVDYGDLRKIVMAKRSNRVDTSGPATKR